MPAPVNFGRGHRFAAYPWCSADREVVSVHPLVTQLEQAFMPRLREIAASAEWLRAGATLTVWSYTVGGATSFDGHSLGVEALLPDRPAHAADNVALSVDLCHLSSEPKVMADVAWGDPAGVVELAFRDEWSTNSDWPHATPEVLAELGRVFPELVATFELALRRGAPPEPRGGRTRG
jgi:hypothetical protein